MLDMRIGAFLRPANTLGKPTHGLSDPTEDAVSSFLRKNRALIFFWGLLTLLLFPAVFSLKPGIGPDSSWMMATNLALRQGSSFGNQFVFTYGPLGFLSSRSICYLNRCWLIGFDLFLAFNLLAIYSAVLKRDKSPLGYALCLGSAFVTKQALVDASTGVLFTAFLFWLLMLWEKATLLRGVAALAAAFLLFFIKINYGIIATLVLLAFVPAAALCRRLSLRNSVGMLFLFIAGLGVMCQALKVQPAQWLTNGLHLIGGYKAAMMNPLVVSSPLFLAAILELLALCVFMVINRRAVFCRRAIALAVLSVGLDSWLIFQNGFTRFEWAHAMWFHLSLPLVFTLLLAFEWSKLLRGARILLVLSLVISTSASLSRRGHYLGRGCVARVLPLSYLKGLILDPPLKDQQQVQSYLAGQAPRLVFPQRIREEIGGATVDVMPWELSLAILNGTKLALRPVIQSYAAYTESLDALNAKFLLSPNAPEFILFHSGTRLDASDFAWTDDYPDDHFSLGNRVPFWDESITRRAMLENYRVADRLDFTNTATNLYGPRHLLVLKRDFQYKRLIPVQTNQVALNLGRRWTPPPTTNLLYLYLDAAESLSGKIKSLLYRPSKLDVTLEYPDGKRLLRSGVPRVLKSGVLVNRRVETADDLATLFQDGHGGLMQIQALTFASDQPWAFRTQMKGQLVEMECVPAPTSTDRQIRSSRALQSEKP